MRTCKNCGVELEQNMNFCPLCGTPVTDENTNTAVHIKEGRQRPKEKSPTEYQQLSSKQKRKLFWEISGMILISGMAITFIIDWLEGYEISWSKYTIVASALLFINTTLICLWPKRILWLILGSWVSISVFLVLLDTLSGNTGWGIRLAIPLLLATYLIIIGLIIIIRKAKQKQLNLIAWSFIATALLTICTNGIISWYTYHTLKLHWSLLVMVSVLPVSAILFFIHYRLKKGIDLKRFFHI